MEKTTNEKGELKRVRYLAFFAYIGRDYHGFQKQPHRVTQKKTKISLI